MRRRLRFHLRLLHGYVVLSSCALVFIALVGAGQPAGPSASALDLARYGAMPRQSRVQDTAAKAGTAIEELTVQRLNVVDANGTLRLVISNKDRMHPGIVDGKTINRPRPVAGLIFFNDEGDEVGGLVVNGQERDGQRRAAAMLAFDQLKQDQTVAISYSETDGQRTAGLQVWDRPEARLCDLIEQLNAANAIQDAAQRDKALQEVREKAPPAPRRVFVGKNTDRSATVSLADANGKPRLTLTVDADGAASIDFLDADGKTVHRLPASR